MVRPLFFTRPVGYLMSHYHYLLMQCEGLGVAYKHVAPGAFLGVRGLRPVLCLFGAALLVVLDDPGHEELEDTPLSGLRRIHFRVWAVMWIR